MDTPLQLDETPVLNVRRETLNGREFLVGDVTFLKEGVLNGSKGALYYPFDEIEKRPGVWNGVILTANHPMNGDKPDSARKPQMMAKYNIGYVFNDYIDSHTKSRRAEVWVDVELANKVDNRLVPAIINGKQINVSTGLFTVDEKVNNEQTYNGKTYTHIARNYQPDHLAVLLDNQGACSIKDGCGINVNSITSGENHMRKELVTWLTTNCDCYKGKDAVLNDDKAFTEDELKKLKANQEQATLAINALSDIGTTLNAKELTVAELKSLITDNAKKCADMDDDDVPNPKATMNADQVKEIIANHLKGLSEKERIDLIASPTVNNLIKTGEEMITEKRTELIRSLTANIGDVKERNAKALKLKNKSLEQLKEIAEFAAVTANAGDSKTEEEKFLAALYNTGTNNSDKRPKTNSKDVLMPTLGVNIYDGEEVEVIEE